DVDSAPQLGGGLGSEFNNAGGSLPLGVSDPILLVDSITVGIREIETYSFDYDSDYDYKTYFTYQHNMYDEVDSEYYPWSNSPLTEGSYLPITDELTVSTYSGTGYNDENYSVTANKNRTRTSNYVEYFTNAEINTGVTGFMEYDDSFNRSVEDTFPQDGIGAYRITGPNGYIYHYSLPVYAHFNTSGNGSLDKDYKVLEPEGGITEVRDSTHGYIIENESTTEIFEIRQTKKYAIRWLLTAITGPDYEDSNSNGMVDLEDAGYWVKYNYGLWTEDFTSRSPYYGANYSFSSNIKEKLDSRFMDNNDIPKVTGKNLSYFETSSQVYYLNKIQSPSHTGLFVRDLRNDEQSMVNNFGYSEYRSTKNLKYVDKDIVYWSGKGSFNVAAPSNLYRHYLTIKPEGVDSLELTINASGWLGVPSSVVVLDGDSTSTDTLVHYYLGCGCISENTVISTGGEITIIGFLDNSGGQISYDISWNSKWKNRLEGWPVGKPKSIPQLKLSKILLFDNADLDALPTIDEFYPEPNPTLWDFTNLNRTDIYSGDWYNNDKSIIDSLALQSVDLEQDYSLAKGYHNNRYVLINSQRKIATPVEVEDNKSVADNYIASSGKLTLNKVIYYGLNKSQTQPSHLFDYNASDSIDNPEYNSLLQDYWGNYKSDADSNMLRGYVSDSSASKTDAWSLRKITSPLGGVTEIIYESDEYEQVLSEEKGGGIRGPIKTFALKNVVPIDDNIGAGWVFSLENQTDDFWNLVDNLPIEASFHSVIPCVWVDALDTTYHGHYVNNILG
ncbi:MAG: hypothetical protein HRT73_13285, partial [Flavobacteriales bacterium]|nr:hypothetical protein [Flavobacteriales bacterium]